MVGGWVAWQEWGSVQEGRPGTNRLAAVNHGGDRLAGATRHRCCGEKGRRGAAMVALQCLSLQGGGVCGWFFFYGGVGWYGCGNGNTR